MIILLRYLNKDYLNNERQVDFDWDIVKYYIRLLAGGSHIKNCRGKLLFTYRI